ncbi:helix-turn-helix domain-containing protein [Streptomyces sp. Go40/10]|uniref:ArsR/SmtB family transcription factor n=1 Tax=Streptomyces sp. Go40/10 TaxID=2825844 RepID=UPI001E5A031B|nr:helix-turn-helix domain-containing protein [Streptomyces sp. Go40/10]UFR02635.1 helix-turn-helix domain-containing protein [Streptomyces sp. Go40/10]
MTDGLPEMTSLERTALYKSLGNPLRRRILDYLGRHGEANSTVLARELGESSGTTSYHLRKLAEQRLIEEIPEKSGGRERWWRVLPFRHTTPDPATMAPEEYTAAVELAHLKIEFDTALYRRAHLEYRGPEGWAQVQRHGAWMTREELLAFMREYHALLERYSHARDEAPDGARSVLMRFYAVPELAEERVDEKSRQAVLRQDGVHGEPTGP